jgi:hypothetical protein
MTSCVNGAARFRANQRSNAGAVAFSSRPCHQLRSRLGLTSATHGFDEMSNTEGTFGPGSGRSRQDPVTGFFLAMRDAWLAGAALKETLTPSPIGSSNLGATSAAAGLLGPMIGVLGAMTDFAAANRQRFDQPDAGPAARSSPPGRDDTAAADLLLPIGHAMMIAANRSVSYWLGLVQIFEGHQAKLAQVVGVEGIEGGAPGSERLIAADELRALLREVGDLATREARILQNELSTLDETLARGFQQPDLSGSYSRRWRSKV